MFDPQHKFYSLQSNSKEKLSIMCSGGFVHFYGIQNLKPFLEEYPDISLSFKTNDLKQELTIDTDICIGPKILEKGIISIHLHSYWLKMYASQNYLDKKGYPEKPKDLDNHQLITYSQDFFVNFDWHLRYGAPNNLSRTPYLEVTSSYALKKAAEMDLGIITFGEFLVKRDASNLVNIFPHEGIKIDVYFSYRTEQEAYWPLVAYKNYLLGYFSNMMTFNPAF